MKRKPRWSCELSASAQKIRKTADVQAPTFNPAASLTKPIGAQFTFLRPFQAEQLVWLRGEFDLIGPNSSRRIGYISPVNSSGQAIHRTLLEMAKGCPKYNEKKDHCLLIFLHKPLDEQYSLAAPTHGIRVSVGR